jgi:23S rRNA (uracil1939-C5)-methyltransferase
MRLRLDSLAVGGEAVGRAEDGRVVFVDGGAPGDLVEVSLTEDKRRFARARVVAVIERGAARVDPPCAYAERCGGCPWQIVRADVQRAAKEAAVRRALGKLDVEVHPLVAAPASLGYRGRVTMHAERGSIGFRARRSHALVEVETCLALEPGLDAAIATARAQLGSALGDEGGLRGTIAPSGRVHLALSPGRGAHEPRLREVARALVDAGVAVGVLVGDDAIGAAFLDAGEGAPFWVSATGFRQANDAQNRVLRALVDESLDVESGMRVLELFAGDGNFTRDLVAGGAAVVAVEEDRSAVERLRKNLPGVQAVCARVETDVRRRGPGAFDRVLLDPPRAGAKDAMAAIARLGAQRIVYVSCDPATLARDLALLEGYRLVGATPIDLMPHTDHVEVVAVAERVI